MSLCFYSDLINKMYIKKFPFKFANILRCGLVKGLNPRKVAAIISFLLIQTRIFFLSQVY